MKQTFSCHQEQC